MKSILSKKNLLLSLAVFGASFSVWSQEFTQGDLKYTVNEDNLSVSVSAAVKNSTAAVVIPSKVTNEGTSYDVTAIAQSGFDHSNFVSIRIPKSVTEVRSAAFQYCEKTESITFEEGCNIKAIESHAFKGCKMIKEFELPEGVETIGPWCMERMEGMFSLTLPSTLKQLGDGSLAWCTGLSVLTMKSQTPPEGPAGIFRDFSFGTCTLFVPDGAIGDYSSSAVWGRFTNIVAGNYVSFTQGDYTYGVVGNKVVQAYKYLGNATEVSIPSKVTHEGVEYAVESLGGSLFNGKAITKVNLPAGLKLIGTSVFENCKQLTEITLPEGLESIEGKAFYNSAIQKFVLPNSVVSLGNKVFPSATTEIEFSTSLTVIPDETCVWSNLTSVIIPEGVTTIKTEAFVCNSKLTSIVLPSTLTKLERKTFGESNSIRSVVCGAKTAPTGGTADTFSGEVYDNAILYVPIGASQSYRSTAPWSSFGSIEEFEYSASNEFTIGDLIYSKISTSKVKVIGVKPSAEIVAIPNAVKYSGMFFTVTEIADNAFSGSSVKSVEIAQSVEKIGNNAFAGLNLTSVKALSATAPVCPENAFSAATYSNATLFVGAQCKSVYEAAPGWKNFKTIVEQVEIGNQITSGNYIYTILEDQCVAIGFTEEALQDKTITEIIIPEEVDIYGETYTVTAIAPRGFYHLQCPGTTPDGKNHLSGCVGTVKVVLPETIIEIGEEAFTDAHVSTINFPESLEVLGKACFSACLMTNDVVIPGNIVEIPKDAFSWLWHVDKITISNGVETVGEYAFAFSRFKEINIPASISTVGGVGFGYLSQLQKVEVDDLECFLNIKFEDSWANPLNQGVDLYYQGEPVTEINMSDYYITALGDYALAGCTSLEKIIFPKNFSRIGYQCFENANNIRTVECMNETVIATQTVGCAFTQTVCNFATLYVPLGCKELYMNDTQNRTWQQFANIVEKDFSGVDDVEADSSDITVNGSDILNPSARQVEVYDAAGTLIYSGNETVIRIAAKGVVIVKDGDKAVKLAL